MNAVAGELCALRDDEPHENAARAVWGRSRVWPAGLDTGVAGDAWGAVLTDATVLTVVFGRLSANATPTTMAASRTKATATRCRVPFLCAMTASKLFMPIRCRNRCFGCRHPYRMMRYA